MLRVTKMTDYATVLLSTMAREPDKLYVCAQLAQAVKLAHPTASKLLKLLAKENILHSQQGADGGYRLARSPASISITDVITAVEGGLALTECSQHSGSCSQEEHCMIASQWQKINAAIYQALAKVSIEDLIQDSFNPEFNIDNLQAPCSVAVTFERKSQ